MISSSGDKSLENLKSENIININDEKTKVKVHETGPDIVRTIAVVFVIAIHFYLNCGYYAEPLRTPKMYVMTVERWLFLICVPLFILLTGYFKSNKTISKSHYMSLIPLFVSYLLISIYKMLLVNRIFGTVYTLDFAIRNLANYQIAWYIGMYMSLMLLVPFLNKMWKACDSRKEHNILIGSLVFISMCYPVFLYIAPSYWQMIYPMAYYFAGTYIKIYKPKPKKWILPVIILVMIIFEASVSYYYAKGSNFNWNILGPTDCGYSTITVAITAVCVFLLFYDVNVSNNMLQKFFKSVSACSFEMYLFSGAYDAVIFYYLKRYIYTAEGFFWWLFITVPVSFVLSWISSIIYKFIYNKISGAIAGKIANKKSETEK